MQNSHTIEDSTKLLSNNNIEIPNNVPPMSPHIRKATLIPNNCKIGDLFNYQSNYVNVNTFFDTVENIFIS